MTYNPHELSHQATRQIVDPYQALATAIIMQAIHERRTRKLEVLDFFQSPWFDTVASLALIDPDVAREKLKVPRPAP